MSHSGEAVSGTCRRLAGLALVLVVFVGVFMVGGRPSSAATCAGSGGVSVVVDPGPLGGGVSTGCAAGDPSSGLAALQSAGFTYAFVANRPGFVCQIDQKPSPCNGAPANAYWSYWYAAPGGAWTYSNMGAGSRDPAPGSNEGWAFGSGAAPSLQPPGTTQPPATQSPATQSPATELPVTPPPTTEASEAPTASQPAPSQAAPVAPSPVTDSLTPSATPTSPEDFGTSPPGRGGANTTTPAPGGVASAPIPDAPIPDATTPAEKTPVETTSDERPTTTTADASGATGATGATGSDSSRLALAGDRSTDRSDGSDPGMGGWASVVVVLAVVVGAIVTARRRSRGRA